jgi:hypothetical protein
MLRVLILVALLAAAPLARACGYCVEDKMASVYDHAVVAKALGQKHQVAFFHVEGALAAGEAGKPALLSIVESSPGVDKGSARVSTESASLAVAFDPRRTSVMALQKELERNLAARKLSLMLLQVMDRPADFSPSASAAMKKEKR